MVPPVWFCDSELRTYVLDTDHLKVRKYSKTDINKPERGAEWNYLAHVETPVDVSLLRVGNVELNLLTIHSQWVTGAYCYRRFRCLYFRISTGFICFPPTPVPSNSRNICSVTPLGRCSKRSSTFMDKLFVEHIFYIYTEGFKGLGTLSPLWSAYWIHLCRQSFLMSQVENSCTNFHENSFCWPKMKMQYLVQKTQQW